MKTELKDVCESIVDGDHQPPPKASSGIPFITISNFDQCLNTIDFTSVSHVPVEYYETLSDSRRARSGDILYSAVGSFGIPVLVKSDMPFVFQRHIAILRPNPKKIDSRFLFYSMKNPEFYRWADAVAIGSAQRTVTLTLLREKEINLPPLGEQERIAGILSTYDKLIENNRKQIKLLEEAVQRLYKEWFIDLKFPGHETTPIDPTTNLPEGWSKGVMSELITFVNGFAFKSEEFTQDGMLSIVTIKNVLDGRFDKNSMSKIDVEPRRMSAECVLKKGDILLSLTGNVGRTCLLTEDNCLLNQRVAKVISTVPAYAYCLLRSDGEKSRMISLSNGTAQLNLSPIRLGADSLLVPSHKVLNMFEDVLKKPLQLILSLNQSSGLLQEARDRLLPKLMSGEIEV